MFDEFFFDDHRGNKELKSLVSWVPKVIIYLERSSFYKSQMDEK